MTPILPILGVCLAAGLLGAAVIARSFRVPAPPARETSVIRPCAGCEGTVPAFESIPGERESLTSVRRELHTLEWATDPWNESQSTTWIAISTQVSTDLSPEELMVAASAAFETLARRCVRTGEGLTSDAMDVIEVAACDPDPMFRYGAARVLSSTCSESSLLDVLAGDEDPRVASAARGGRP